MSATTRRTARIAAVLAAVPVALGSSALPAWAVPDPGAPVPTTSVVLEGCDADADWPTYPGWRGSCLRPEQRGPVLEFLDR